MAKASLDKAYAPHEVERRWYAFWEENGFFAAEEESDRPSFSIVIPPPNVTGVLHMGHALNNTLQDILCRYRRLCGDNVLWMPGTDHAGIATQNVVERKLAERGLTREALGRERFIEEVWRWRETYGSAIIHQLKRLGASCDWKRERFTMDEGLSRAVRKVFVDLYHEGLIYRGDYIINWCPRCRTALADLEVEHEETEGRLYHIRYPFAGAAGGLTVATTRPETMLGDTAVAVHPEDERYAALPAVSVILPLLEREIPVIRDAYVERGFGTGALKVTPAHDPNDFEIARRHGLPAIKVIGDDGRMTEEAGPFRGLDRFECRKRVVAELERLGLLAEVRPHRHAVGHCYRCRTAIEPNLSRQWFVRTRPLAEPAIAAVREGRTRIIPETWANTYFDWMENIRDWCISRQIWWGHPIPAWTCTACGEVHVAMEAPGRCAKCGANDLAAEPDVLDTWFSSALWPFSTLGWPEDTALLRRFYPTSVLVTGFDILFFWVARMMMMGLHFLKAVPFRDVYVHALVRDEEGQKMSKSKGNVIDPLEIIDRYGTDAFRFTLAAFAAQGRDIKMSEKRVEGYRHFINKIWNAARFTLMHLESEPTLPPREELSLADRWILSRLADAARETRRALEAYRFNDAAATLYRFVWHEFCDWYLEAAKPALQDPERPGAQAAARAVLGRVLRDALVLLHPFVPFVTEEIWHHLPGTSGSISRAALPEVSAFQDAAAEERMGILIAAVTAVRNLRGETGIAPGQSLEALVHAARPEVRETLAGERELVMRLARLSALSFLELPERPRGAATAVAAGATIYVRLEGVLDFAREAARLEKELGKIEKELGTLERKLGNAEFLAKAPAEVVQNVRAQQAELGERRGKLRSHLERIRAYDSAS